MNINSTIISGYKALDDIQYLLKDKMSVLIVTDKNIIALPQVTSLIKHVQTHIPTVTIIDTIPPEPSQHDVKAVLQTLNQPKVDLVIGVGGGSVLDVAKLLSLLCAGDPAITLDALFDGVKPSSKTCSLLIPTTAGTGSESTPNAILAIPEKETKVGIITPVMLPDYVALIPELTTSMPAHIAASTGIDALCHLIECFTSKVANPVSENYSLIGLKKLFESIETAVAEPNNLQARLTMLWASYYGGASISHSSTHLVHAMSYPLGGKYHIPHGIANAILLAPCMRAIAHSVTDKFAQVYDLLPNADHSLSNDAKATALVDYLTALVKRLNLPSSLQELGIPKEDLPYLVQSAKGVERLMKNVPAQLSDDDIQSIYQSLIK